MKTKSEKREIFVIDEGENRLLAISLLLSNGEHFEKEKVEDWATGHKKVISLQNTQHCLAQVVFVDRLSRERGVVEEKKFGDIEEALFWADNWKSPERFAKICSVKLDDGRVIGII
jgi:hypothetical protein